MIKAVIIDDVEKARIALRSDVEDYCPEVEIVGEADGVATGFELINELNPQLVLLDIKMGDGSGFDLLEKLKGVVNQNFQVIFTTAYDSYAIQAFKFSAIDYLLKPIDPEDLKAAVAKLQPAEQLPASLDLLLSHLQPKKKLPKKIALSSTERIHFVEVEDIIRCEAHKNYTLFYLKDKKQILVTKTLKDYDELLSQYDFVRVHHSHLVNLSFVKEFVKIDGTYLVMTDDSEVPVSVRKKDDLMKKIGG